ncbi:MAG: hypothetical protein A4E53_01066 [Pelotomaculum sp. PtaB.Bin104]|nr:MAG: hypothetical protein A4E53_01066 [Pelotomaculum sp. PtaB.Bin104]
MSTAGRKFNGSLSERMSLGIYRQRAVAVFEPELPNGKSQDSLSSNTKKILSGVAADDQGGDN